MIPFIGAGASRLAGCPGWGELADSALRSFVDHGKFSYGQLDQIRHLNPRVKLSIALGLQAEHGLPIDFAKLLRPTGGYDNEHGRQIYRSIAKLGKSFVTTNYDSWLDTEFPISKPVVNVAEKQETPRDSGSGRVVYDDAEHFTPSNLNQPRSVFHLHGSLRNSNGMVLTTKDYVARYAADRNSSDPQKENRTLTFLEHLFGQKTVLFIGYALEDLEILEYVVQKAGRVHSGENTEARHFMLQGFYLHEYELMRSLKNYYRNQCGIQLLPFRRDQKDWLQLLDVLEKFAEAAPASEPIRLQELMEMEAFLD
ncbi:MAG TPA: SIR2 family protein [Micropepsaceae bacterium]|nr:SIR2 family protein [Micropepsaceae bacterium]